MVVIARSDDRPDRQLLGGSSEDFGAFYRRHEDQVLGYFLRRTGQADLTADLTAETFARALAGRATFDSELGEAVGWLFGIARHVLARSLERGRVDDDVRRRLAMEPLVLNDDVLASIEDVETGPALTALDELPRSQRDAVRSRVIDDREYGEVASELRCSPGVVRQRVSRGLRAIQAQLKENR